MFFTRSWFPVVEVFSLPNLLGVVGDVPVGQHHALGGAGGAGGEKHGGLEKFKFKFKYCLWELGVFVQFRTTSFSTSMSTGVGSP